MSNILFCPDPKPLSLATFSTYLFLSFGYRFIHVLASCEGSQPLTAIFSLVKVILNKIPYIFHNISFTLQELHDRSDIVVLWPSVTWFVDDWRGIRRYIWWGICLTLLIESATCVSRIKFAFSTQEIVTKQCWIYMSWSHKRTNRTYSTSQQSAISPLF